MGAQAGIAAAMAAMGGWGMFQQKRMNRRQRREMKEAGRYARHLNPNDFLPGKLVKKGDFKLKKISGHNRKKYHKEIRAYKKADRQFRKLFGFKGGAKGRWGNNILGLGPMGNKGVKGFGKGFAKQQRKFNREIAKQKRYRREDLRRIRKFEKGAEKGKNVRYVSPFNKEQQKLMRELPKKYLERAAKGKLNIKKDPLYKSGQKYIKEGLKEKFPKKAPKISKKDMEAMKQLSLKEFKESFVPALASRFGGGKYGSGALNLALAKAGKDLQQQFDAMNYQRKAGNIDIAQRHQQIREVMKGRQQDLLGKGLMMAQAPIENAQNMAQLGLSQAPNQPYFLNPPVLKSALMQGRQPSPMPPVMGQPYQPQQFQKQPGFFQQAAAGLAGGLGQAAGMWGMNQLFGQPAAAAAGAQRMDMGGFNNMGAPQRQDIGGFNNLGPIELS